MLEASFRHHAVLHVRWKIAGHTHPILSKTSGALIENCAKNSTAKVKIDPLVLKGNCNFLWPTLDPIVTLLENVIDKL